MDIDRIFMNDVLRVPSLSQREQRELIKLAKAGDLDARNRLIMASMPFVIMVATKFKRPLVEFLDLVQVGVMSAMHAIEKFEVDRKTTFLTYAGYWIYQAMQRHSADTRTAIRVPAYAQRNESHYASDESKAAAAVAAQTQHLSDAMVPAVADEWLPDYLTDYEDEAAVLRQHMAKLNDRERDVLQRRASGETLLSISKSYGVISEAIRQTEKRALKKLAVAYGQSPERVKSIGSG